MTQPPPPPDAPPPSQPSSRPPLQAPPPVAMLRPALALIAGLGVTALVTVSGVVVVTLAAMRGTTAATFRPSPGYLTANLVIVALGAAAGGFTTSRITAGRSLFTVLVLALIMLVSGVVPVLRGTPPQPGQPAWYPLVLALLTPACALIGGLLERRRAAG